MFIAICAVSLSLGSHTLLQLPPIPWAYYAIVGMGTILVYNLHRAYGFVGVDKDQRPDRFRRFYELRFWNGTLSILGAGLIFWLLLSHPSIWSWALFPPLILAVLYILPLRNGQSLRQVPFLKIFLIASTWVWVSTYLPIHISGVEMDTEKILFLCHRFIFIFAITIPFDIRDVYTDQVSHLQTLPSYYGIERSRVYASGGVVASFLLLAPLFFTGFFPILLSPLQVIFMVSLLTLIRRSSPARSEYFFGYMLDGSMLVLGTLETVAGLYF